MNVLILPSWYPSNKNPINGVFFKEQAEELQKYIFMKDSVSTVTVISISQFGVKSIIDFLRFPCYHQSIINDVLTIRTKLLLFPKLYSYNSKRGGKILKNIVHKVEKKNNLYFDIVHIHSVLNAGVFFACSKLTIPYIVTEHSSSFPRKLIKKNQVKFINNCLNNSIKIFAVGKGLSENIKEYTKNSVDVLFNIVKDIQVPDVITNQQNVFTFFSIGLDSYVKGFDVLLKAFKIFLKQEKGFLTIAGLSGKEKKDLNKLVLELELIENVLLLERLSREETFSNMSKSDCFVLTSRFETFGIVFAEAMYLGKPVIASRTGGPDSFVTPETGVLVRVEDIIETAKAMTFLKVHYDDYSPIIIKMYAKNNFSPEVICSKLYETYRKILC